MAVVCCKNNPAVFLNQTWRHQGGSCLAELYQIIGPDVNGRRMAFRLWHWFNLLSSQTVKILFTTASVATEVIACTLYLLKPNPSTVHTNIRQHYQYQYQHYTTIIILIIIIIIINIIICLGHVTLSTNFLVFCITDANISNYSGITRNYKLTTLRPEIEYIIQSIKFNKTQFHFNLFTVPARQWDGQL